MKLKVKNGFAFGTPIEDVHVPEILRKRVPTGVNFVDDALGGRGFTPSTAVILCGTPGAGKSTMSLLAADKLAEKGNLVVFNTAEESLYQVKLHAERLNLGGFLLGEESHVPTLLKGCDKLQKAHIGKQMVLFVDSLQTLDDGKFPDGATNSATAGRALEMITDWCKRTNSIAVVIGQVTKDGHFAGKNVIKHLVDAFLELTIDDKKTSPTFGLRVLSTLKNRFGGAGQLQFIDVTSHGFVRVAQDSAE